MIMINLSPLLTHLAEFIASAALDEIAARAAANQASGTTASTSNLFLKEVDSFSDNFLISAYVTHARVVFLLLHKHRNEEAIRNFFSELHELYAKTVIMNPFYTPFRRVEGGLRSLLEARVGMLGKRHFGSVYR